MTSTWKEENEDMISCFYLNKDPVPNGVPIKILKDLKKEH